MTLDSVLRDLLSSRLPDGYYVIDIKVIGDYNTKDCGVSRTELQVKGELFLPNGDRQIITTPVTIEVKSKQIMQGEDIYLQTR